MNWPEALDAYHIYGQSQETVKHLRSPLAIKSLCQELKVTKVWRVETDLNQHTMTQPGIIRSLQNGNMT